PLDDEARLAAQLVVAQRVLAVQHRRRRPVAHGRRHAQRRDLHAARHACARTKRTSGLQCDQSQHRVLNLCRDHASLYSPVLGVEWKAQPSSWSEAKAKPAVMDPFHINLRRFCNWMEEFKQT
ncbi:Protein of unknown function, partial [Gryllus bimaculatus]